VESATRKKVEEISRDCEICRRFGPAPRRTRSSIPSDHIQFNVKVSLDIFFLDATPLLHVICRGIRFSATAFLSEKTFASVGRIFLHIWVYAYLGPPHELLVDHGTEVTSSLFRRRCRETGIHLVFAPVDSHSSLGLVERMHGPVRRIYQKLLMKKTSNETKSRELLLSAATKALNDTACVNGLEPTFLVFGVLPNIIVDVKQTKYSFPTQRERLHLMAVARSEAEAQVAAARLSEAEKHAVPSGDYLLSPGDAVLVFREKNGWQGPATFLDRIDGKVRVSINRKRVTFPSTRFKPATALSKEIDSASEDLEQERAHSDDSKIDDEEIAAPHNSFTSVDFAVPSHAHESSPQEEEPIYVNEVVHDSDDTRFAVAISKEIEGLMKREVFETVDATSVPPGSNVMGSKFHLVIKNSGMKNQTFKALLVIFGNTDSQKHQILSEAPTVGQLSIRILIYISVIKSWPLWSRDVRQAFFQSE
jgi:hypothetical protein